MDAGSLIFILVQVLFAVAFAVLLYYVLQPVNWVNVSEADSLEEEDFPYIVLFYPVLREPLETMRTTFTAINKLNYPRHKYRVVAIPNESDTVTHEFLLQLAEEFPFLEVMAVPSTQSPKWQVVWDAWDKNAGATWWNSGPTRGDMNLPPKKTRQMIFAFYHIVEQLKLDPAIRLDHCYLDYIDADSAPQVNHFRAAAAGVQHYDVLQCTNIAGNLLQTLPASWMAMDHLNWDYKLYPHMSANGHHPFWVLGKGLFFAFTDLIEVGGFDPWIAIEDPDIGLRLFAQGKTIGIIEEPLIEEVPITLQRCIVQRKRWICGFFQANFGYRKSEGLTPGQRVRAVLNLVPVMSLVVNGPGLPLALWAVIVLIAGTSPLPHWLLVLSVANVVAYCLTLAYFYQSAWIRIRQVLPHQRDRVRYMLRVNPVFLWIYWVIWIIPIGIGLKMFLTDGGLIWQRTEKVDANHHLVRQKLETSTQPPAEPAPAAVHSSIRPR